MTEISRLSGTDLLLKNGNISNGVKTNLTVGFRFAYSPFFEGHAV
jgi:hypothetical protein